MHLEAANWNLLEALQVVMPQEATTATPTQPPPLQAVSQVRCKEIFSLAGTEGVVCFPLTNGH